MREMRDNQGALPLLAILVIIGVVLLLMGWIVIALTMQSMLAIILVGAGLYLFVRPSALSGLGTQARIAVPLVLIVLGIVVYGGLLSF
jgi:hypothetical protein